MRRLYLQDEDGVAAAAAIVQASRGRPPGLGASRYEGGDRGGRATKFRGGGGADSNINSSFGDDRVDGGIRG